MNVTANAPMASNGQVTSEVIRALSATKGWVRFLAILGFIMTAFMVIGSLGIIVTMGGSYMGGLGVIMGLAYLVLAILNFFAAFKLNQYASRISEMLVVPSEIKLVAALEAQRGFWKYVGIMAIVVIVIYVLAIGAAVAS